jgi:hypothetical protein
MGRDPLSGLPGVEAAPALIQPLQIIMGGGDAGGGDRRPAGR